MKKLKSFFDNCENKACFCLFLAFLFLLGSGVSFIHGLMDLKDLSLTFNSNTGFMPFLRISIHFTFVLFLLPLSGHSFYRFVRLFIGQK